MLERALNSVASWGLDRVGQGSVDYVVSNTMTEFNRRCLPFVWTYDLKALVEQVIDEAADVKTFVLRPNQHWPGMKPGQHIEVLLKLGDQVHHRCYSPSVRPNGRLAITVKRKEGGVVSPWLHSAVRPGQVLTLGKPRGHFTLGDPQLPGKVLMLAAGSGITPIASMVAQCLSMPADQRPDLNVMAQFRLPGDVIFRADMLEWSATGVPVTVALSQPSVAPVADGLQTADRLDEALILRRCPDVAERHVYLCGPDGFMQKMLQALKALGVPARHIHTERFEMATALPLQGDQVVDLDGAEVVFEHINAAITLKASDQGKTLLQLANEHGLHLEQGCGKGACGTCKLTVHEGQAHGNVLGSSVYLCTSFPGSRNLVLGA
ncbi:MAG: 2Fe-2S iron-sulfur cluster binding domain-containing protein [Gammaproteobacteria bacterium]|nr:2Fe-2S iron-sulfur cluster binding domain-containing protein [Gammaproteobacteria bacterium]